MLRAILLLNILFCVSCIKEQPCGNGHFKCTHVVYFGYLACPDNDTPGKWVYSNPKSYTETAELTACDTSDWLEAARMFDEAEKHDPNVETWDDFARLHPNQCGCE